MAQNKPKTNQANSNRHGPKITSNTRQSRISKNFIYSKRDVNDADYLLKTGFKIEYINAQSCLCSISRLVEHLHINEINEIHYVDVTDNWLKNACTSSKKT